jgi:Ca2+-transporting ATPase
VLAVPAVGRLFSFVQPSPPLLLAALGGSVLSWMWFEGVKWAFHRRPMR